MLAYMDGSNSCALRRRKVCSATGRTPQINTVVDPIRWYRLTVVVCSQRTGWKEQPPGRTVKTTVRLGHSDPTHQAAQKGQTSHPPNPSAPRRALSRARAFQFSLLLFRGVAKAALDCAHRTSTVSSCAFCEQGGHVATPSSSFSGRALREHRDRPSYPAPFSAAEARRRPCWRMSPSN